MDIISLHHTFIDKIRLTQVNDGSYPVLNGGRQVTIDENNRIEYTKDRYLHSPGSYDSTFHIRIDDERININYNPSRYNQPDNIFGLKIHQVWPQVDKIMKLLGQPPLVPGSKLLNPYGPEADSLDGLKYDYKGIEVTNLDLTTNINTGSPDDLEDTIHYLLGQKLGPRLNPRNVRGSVCWGRAGRGISVKVYRKAQELWANNISKKKTNLTSNERFVHHQYLKSIHEMLLSSGALRLELSLGRRYLLRHAMRASTDITQAKLDPIINEVFQKMANKPIPKTALNKLSNGQLGTLLMYEKGIDVRKKLTNQTLYRHRAAIKEATGLDICVSNSNVHQLQPTRKVITLSELAPPADYDWNGENDELLEN